MRWLGGLFLIAHGLVHVGVWAAPFDPTKGPFDPRRSWLLAGTGLAAAGRAVAVGLAVSCAVGFTVAGVGVLADASWAAGLTVAVAALSSLLTLGWFHRWLGINLVINLAIVAVVA